MPTQETSLKVDLPRTARPAWKENGNRKKSSTSPAFAHCL